jgi:hypothetical protein
VVSKVNDQDTVGKMRIQKTSQSHRNLLRGELASGTKQMIAIGSAVLIIGAYTMHVNYLRTEAWRQRESLTDPRRSQVEAIQKQEAQQMAAAETNHTYAQMQKYWAPAGGVPDLVAWQTPEGRAAAMAAKRAVSEHRKWEIPGKLILGTWLGVGGAAVLLTTLKKRVQLRRDDKSEEGER